MKVTPQYLNRFNHVQLRVYTSTGKYLKPITDWYKIGNEWGLKIKRGQFSMKKTDSFINSLNKKMEELEHKKIPYSMNFFDGTMYFDTIHNLVLDKNYNVNWKQTTRRQLDTELD